MDAVAGRSLARIEQSDPQVDRATLIDLRQIGAVIRRRWLIILASLLTAMALAAVAYMAMPRRYTATAQVALERKGEHVINVESVAPDADPDSPAVDTEVAVLQSPELAGKVVDQLRLDADPEFNKAAKPGAINAKADPVGRQRAIGVLMGDTSIKRVGLSYAIGVSVEAGTASRAAQIANAIVENYVGNQTGSKAEATQRAKVFLDERLKELRTQVQSAERAVANYRAAHGLFAVSNASTATQEEMSNLSTQLAQAQAESAAAQARLATAKAQLARGSTGEELGEALESPVISQLRGQRAQAARDVASLEKRYGPRYPDLVRAQNALKSTDAAIASEVQRVVANISNQANIASQRAASLSGSLAQARGQMASDNEASVGLNELERNAESARTLYQAFMDRYRQTVAQQGLERSDSYIVSHARVPGMPTSPNVVILGAVAVVGGAGVAVMLVLLLQLLERGVESSEAIERNLGLPVLSSIPDARTLPGYRRARLPAPPAELPLRRPQSAFAEAFRSLRTSIQFAGAGSVKVVALTSAVPGEGKTTTAMGLARAAATSGARVLVIDCDSRRRGLSRQFVEHATVGLSDVIAGSATLDQAVVKDDLSNALILPQRLDATDIGLAESEKLADMIQPLRDHFDLIILDTPPVLAVDEARVLASIADGVVLLVGWRKTAAKAPEIALRQLYDVHTNVVGAVLTMVDVREQERSGFGEARYHLRNHKSYYTN